MEEARVLAEANVSTLVPLSVLTETHSLVLYRLGLSVARRWLQEVFDSAGVVIPIHDDLLIAHQVLERYGDQPISLVDAMTAAMSQRLRLPVWTYDHHFDVMQMDVWRPA